MVLVPEYTKWDGVTINGDQAYKIEAYSCLDFDVERWECSCTGECSIAGVCRHGLIFPIEQEVYVERDGEKVAL